MPAQAVRAGEPVTYFSIGADYSSGDYGTANTTRVLYMPLTWGMESGRSVFEVTLPLLSVSGPGDVLYTNTGGMLTRMPRPIIPGGGSATSTEAGLGDILASGSYDFWLGRDGDQRLGATAWIKFGTADADAGLGTGETDYSLELNGATRVAGASLYGSLGYSVLGDPPGLDLDNVYYALLGVSRKLAGDRLAGIEIGARQATLPELDPRAVITVYYDQPAGAGVTLSLSLLTGLTDGSPDWGAGLRLRYDR